LLEKKTLKTTTEKQGEAINNQVTIQKYEEVRLMTTVIGYNAWVKNTIMKEGIVSFVLSPIPDRLPPDNCQPVRSEPMHGAARDKLTDVLMTVILNLMTEGIAI
jgi:hypothetical protein